MFNLAFKIPDELIPLGKKKHEIAANVNVTYGNTVAGCRISNAGADVNAVNTKTGLQPLQVAVHYRGGCTTTGVRGGYTTTGVAVSGIYHKSGGCTTTGGYVTVPLQGQEGQMASEGYTTTRARGLYHKRGGYTMAFRGLYHYMGKYGKVVQLVVSNGQGLYRHRIAGLYDYRVHGALPLQVCKGAVAVSECTTTGLSGCTTTGFMGLYHYRVRSLYHYWVNVGNEAAGAVHLRDLGECTTTGVSRGK
ncbi:hypothetical protein DPMN_097146 [Dreissena polymorpha]|uniref:Uncharacterized protein n=1 Tax=Dreissena polymorpha TaxID=45954 RepID=A0A9D4LAK5_DREPO|nr:hypothetical protein DPMN_097146 [Dreissena polymorpha]